MTFPTLALIDPLLQALTSAGYTEPTPIQAQAIPVLLAGRDLCGTAQTGTGKTAAFVLPILQRLATVPGAGGIRALILAPTRELAAQIDAAVSVYGQKLPEIRHAYVFGGMKQRAQRRALEAGADLLVATPGRLLDLCGQGIVRLDAVEFFVLDEADRMLDQGLLQDVRAIAKRLPPRRQTALFSATFPPDIERLAAQILANPLRVSVARSAAVADHIDQFVCFVEKGQKRQKLLEILVDPAVRSAIVFVRTRLSCERVAAAVGARQIRVSTLHGDKVQADRTRALAEFTRGDTRVLVATDIAARGIDIDHISHILNYDVPNVAEAYVHRVGRTARAGAAGVAISLCSPEERPFLLAIERLTGHALIPMA